MQDNVTLTAGICNIPLTLPAIPYFISDNDNTTLEITKVLSSFNIPFNKQVTASGKTHISGFDKIQPSIIKQLFRNFRTLKPRLISEYRYLFWEIDSQDTQTLDSVMSVYMYLKLPVYVHKSFRGYHFLSVKPIQKSIWDWAIQKLRDTNPRFPPVTLRVLANKHDGELDIYKNGYCYYPDDKIHRDTESLRKYIENQDIQSLEHYYMIVFYPLPKQNMLDNMTLEERVKFQEKQVEDSI